MTPKEATRIVRNAFRVIVDGVLGTNSHPKESWQKKYQKVDKVTQEVVDVLDREFELTLDIYYIIRSNIARGILKFKKNNPGSYLAGEIPPEEWMFAEV